MGQGRLPRSGRKELESRTGCGVEEGILDGLGGQVQPFAVMEIMEDKLGCVKGEGLVGFKQAAVRSRAVTLTLTC